MKNGAETFGRRENLAGTGGGEIAGAVGGAVMGAIDDFSSGLAGGVANFSGGQAGAANNFSEKQAGGGGAELVGIPEGVRASVAPKVGEYDARRLRSQREIIRDVMLAAAGCETWLTLTELRALTRYGEASISAQLRHLRKSENGGYDVVKRHREGVCSERRGTDGRGECVWEYRITRGLSAEGVEERLAAVGA